MLRSLSFLSILAVLVSMSLSTASDSERATASVNPPLVLYVSPTGNDNNPGTATQPVQTLPHAQALVRSMIRTMRSNITVYLDAGIYRLSEPLRFTSQDSGTNGHNVVWSAAPGAKVVLSGSIQIRGWQLSVSSKDIWVASVPATLQTRQIYVNGMRASMAEGRAPVRLQKIQTGYIASSPLMANWRNPSAIEFVYPEQLNFQAAPMCPVSTIKGKIITMAEPCWKNSNLRRDNIVGWPSGFLLNPDYIENAYPLLTQPGQFYLDDTAHKLYYIPRTDQNMATADVEAPALQTLVEGSGTSAQPIHNITFSQIQFSYATWMGPDTPTGFSEQQSGYTITGKRGYAVQGLCKLVPHGTCPYGAWTKEPGNVQFSYDQNIFFIDDRFVHLGAAALNLDNGSQDDTVEGSIFTDISGNGIEIGNVNMPQATGASQTAGITVSDNYLFGLPSEFVGGVPVVVGYAAGTRISHNQIDHVPGMAISIGWGGWLDKLRQPPVPNFSHNNSITDNLIFDFEQILKDGGGIYTQGIQGQSMDSGLRVAGNVIHSQLDWGGALKADNGTTYVTYERNVLFDDTYDWDGIHWDYSEHAGTRRPTQYDPESLIGNWWQQGDPGGSSQGIVKTGNRIIAGPKQVPASILNQAGVESQYRRILAWIPGSKPVPNSPREVSALYAFHGEAYITWHPSYETSGLPVASYTLRACKSSDPMAAEGCPQSPIASRTVPARSLDENGYAILSGLTDGQTYTVSIVANNANGSSLASLPSAPITPRATAPGLLKKPTDIWVETANRAITLMWYRPSNVKPLLLLDQPRHDARAPVRRSTSSRLLVLGYVITSSTGEHYNLTGHEQLIDTNTGSRVLDVISDLSPSKSFRFSIAAVDPSGVGPAAWTGWIRPGS